MTCPQCGVSAGRWHAVGCSWEQCPYCGGYLAGCGHEPPLDDRLPWSGQSFWEDACLSLGFFRKQVVGLWVPCRADDPEARADIARLLRRGVWNRQEKRFEARRRSDAGGSEGRTSRG
jgi:hypothetical protein